MKKKRKVLKKKQVAKINHKAANAALVIFILLIGVVLGAVGQRYIGFVKDYDIVKVEKDGDGFVIDSSITYISIPAVNKEGEGVATKLGVKIEEGTGKTLVDIDSLLYWVDTQNSIRMAKLVAEDITGVSTEHVDITYSIDAEASLIGGESAGAALAIATIAALQNKQIKDDVIITGTVNHDGSIGPIGGVLEKARAAKQSDANLLLVPLLQSREVIYEEREHCEKFGMLEWCTTERIPVQVDISAESGLEVKEIGTIRDALDYFIIS